MRKAFEIMTEQDGESGARLMSSYKDDKRVSGIDVTVRQCTVLSCFFDEVGERFSNFSSGVLGIFLDSLGVAPPCCLACLHRASQASSSEKWGWRGTKLRSDHPIVRANRHSGIPL